MNSVLMKTNSRITQKKAQNVNKYLRIIFLMTMENYELFNKWYGKYVKNYGVLCSCASIQNYGREATFTQYDNRCMRAIKSNKPKAAIFILTFA